MAIITIARELAALGEEIAAELSKKLKYKVLDKDYLESQLDKLGLSKENQRKFDEKKPGFWASMSQDRDNYLHNLRTVLFEATINGNCIVVGRGGGAILAGVKNALSIKVVASISQRVERVMKMFSCNEKNALQIIEQSDHDRAGFHKFFFALDWNDAHAFSLVINTDKVNPEASAEVITETCMATITADMEAEGKSRLQSLALGQKIAHEVIYVQRIAIHFFEAEVAGDKAILHGVANTQNMIDDAITAARMVSGVNEVENAIQLVHEFTVMP